MDLIVTLKDKAEIFNNFWTKYFPQGEPANLFQATWHLPSGGGKRLRPILSMLTAESIVTHNQTFFFSSMTTSFGENSLSLCEPSQKGWFADLPQAHHQ